MTVTGKGPMNGPAASPRHGLAARAQGSPGQPAPSSVTYPATKNESELVFCPACDAPVAMVAGRPVDAIPWIVLMPNRRGRYGAVGIGGIVLRGDALGVYEDLAGAVAVAKAFGGMVGRRPHHFTCKGGGAA